MRRSSKSGSHRPRPLSGGHVAAGVHGQAVEPRPELRVAAELADAHAELRKRLLGRVACVLRIVQQMTGEPLHTWGMPLAQCGERRTVAVLRSGHQDRIAQPLVRERPGGPQLDTLTAAPARRLHAGSLLVALETPSAPA